MTEWRKAWGRVHDLATKIASGCAAGRVHPEWQAIAADEATARLLVPGYHQPRGEEWSLLSFDDPKWERRVYDAVKAELTRDWRAEQERERQRRQTEGKYIPLSVQLEAWRSAGLMGPFPDLDHYLEMAEAMPKSMVSFLPRRRRDPARNSRGHGIGGPKVIVCGSLESVEWTPRCSNPYCDGRNHRYDPALHLSALAEREWAVKGCRVCGAPGGDCDWHRWYLKPECRPRWTFSQRATSLPGRAAIGIDRLGGIEDAPSGVVVRSAEPYDRRAEIADRRQSAPGRGGSVRTPPPSSAQRSLWRHDRRTEPRWTYPPMEHTVVWATPKRPMFSYASATYVPRGPQTRWLRMPAAPIAVRCWKAMEGILMLNAPATNDQEPTDEEIDRLLEEDEAFRGRTLRLMIAMAAQAYTEQQVAA